MRRMIGLVCLFAFTVNAMAQDNWEDSVRIYTEKARRGEALAYEKLAGYYHDGVVVEHNFVNMLAMYIQASERGGLSVEEYMHRYKEEDPDRLLFDAMTDMDHKRMGDFRIKLNRLKMMDHVGYVTLQAVSMMNQDEKRGKQLLRQASEEGCMLGRFLYALSLEGIGNGEEYEAMLLSLVKNTPMAYNLLGRFYWVQAGKNGKMVLMKSAIESFREADRWACLTKEDAERLFHYYKNELDAGRNVCDSMELKHLRRVACIDIETE